MFNPQRWFVTTRKEIAKDTLLVCLHHAGGSASFFSSWGNEIIDQVGLLPVELPGRGTRISESPITDIDEIVIDLSNILTAFPNKKFILLGHSMGAYIAMELARQMGDRVCMVVASGCRAIHLHDDPTSESYQRRQARGGIPTHELDMDAFIEELRCTGGTPEAALASQELMELCASYVQADYHLVDNYKQREQDERKEKIRSPILVLSGEEDPDVSMEDLHHWQELSHARCWIESFPGGHFYLQEHQSLVIDKINAYLGQILLNDLESISTS